MVIVLSALVLLLQLIPFVASQSKEFVSLDCGGSGNYTDTSTGFNWVSDASFIQQGKVTLVKASNETRQQYKYRRDFPADNKKYCYTLGTVQRRRYLVRATFYFGNSESEETFPKFDLYLDSTMWDTVSITDSSRTYVKEMIIRSPSTSVDVCLCCASTGSPFISTVELRPLNLSMYATDYEDEFYLAVATRVNFGALSADAIRYPDDPFDRIWESDLERRPNFLVGIAPGTERRNSSKSIKTDYREFPPVKVMQTAVVGTRGSLTYRINLEGFPANGRANARALAYLAEIEELELNETRKFTLTQPSVPGFRDVVVDISENADGSYKLYEPSYMNISLPFVLSFAFTKTLDSTRGPLLNAFEISRYVEIVPRTDPQDSVVLVSLQAMAAESDWATENGDPCNPAPWHWVRCSSTSPPRITKIVLSGKNLSGTIPPRINRMRSLSELWLDGNSLFGSIPDMSELSDLTIVHLENNRLTGRLPSYLGDLPSLRELYVQNNSFSGEIPPSLLTGRISFYFDGNPDLHERKKNLKLIIGISVGAFAFLVVLLVGSFFLLRHLHRKRLEPKAEEKYNSSRMMSKRSSAYSIGRGGSTLIDEGQEIAYITLTELQGATHNFNKKIGKGSFGPVYYGKMKDGKEVAVKIMADSSLHGTRQFVNEVSLLSRIHHRNLVPLIGYCEEGSQRILVYEYMHNGSLRDQLHDSVKQKNLDWLSRLYIAEDAAKGLEYLHSGCIPSIIHRDVKSSNILLDINMRAKVSDFGLSRQADENLTHVSSVARGTVGYLDPEYYACQQLTEKSDVYSFGVVLLELISGRKPISAQDYGAEWNIVHWARSFVRRGDLMSIVDPSVQGKIKLESVWRIAEIAIQSVEPHGSSRPKMQEIVLTIQEAIRIERGNVAQVESSSEFSTGRSFHEHLDSIDIECPDISSKLAQPTAR
ncbi:hypothetical protein H6P81_012481 [Aristolochia fimbriata]|uniref:non-specific serine/threonine protein kinase n=1 Tax=Aristolochia fimbriata TaxID=158543 RepID=A0AAV7EC89_ARIFI|nr:hypothetical protein H6P81_012481 [Aristolochia fimbriata]